MLKLLLFSFMHAINFCKTNKFSVALHSWLHSPIHTAGESIWLRGEWLRGGHLGASLSSMRSISFKQIILCKLGLAAEIPSLLIICCRFFFLSVIFYSASCLCLLTLHFFNVCTRLQCVPEEFTVLMISSHSLYPVWC